MIKKMLPLLMAILLCSSRLAAIDWPLSEKEKKALMPEDLGPETIDVSGYPDEHKANYRLFLYKCSRCHTAARAINSPAVTAEEWKKYIGMMHTLSRKGWLWPEDRQWIREFLVYDAQVRKVERRDAFLKQQKALEDRYRKVLSTRDWTEEEERHENP